MSELNGHIPEHELLEFIEGTLPPAREAVVSAALASDPRLARLVAAMQADRRTLVALGDVHAPLELAERVESILERQALLGLTDLGDSAGTAGLPVSRLRPSRGSIVARAWRHPATRGLCAAAALALIAGGGFWAYSELTRAPEAGGPADTLIASGEPDTAAPGPVVDEDAPSPLDEIAAAPKPDVSDATEVAIAPSRPEDLAATGAAVGNAVSDAALAIASPSPRHTEPAADVITAARAVELARRGLLAIVVETSDTDAAVMRVDSLARGTGSGRSASWRRIDGGAVGGEMDPGYETVAALWSPHFAPSFDLPAPHLPNAPTTAVAGGSPMAPALWPGIRLPMELPRWSPPMSSPAAVYAVSVEDREAVLVSLLAALRKDASAGQPARGARFVQLPVAIDPVPAADPDAVLWWADAPSHWTWRISVPVIIQQRVP